MADRTVRVRVLAEMPGYGLLMRGGAADTALLGEAAVAAGRGVRTLGVDATAARAGLTGLATGARGSAAAVSEADAAALAAGRGLRGVRGETTAATGVFGRMGASARSGLGSVRSGAESALTSMRHLGTLLAGGALIYGLHDIVHLGNEYTDSMNKFLEVTRASGGQMQAAGREAQALGADMKLPSANAAEAANAMVDLAKAGLGAEDAIKAARGTIQLAAAARTDVATAAQIEGDIMDQFALKSTEAAHVADILANTSNSASGQLMDIYYAMKYVGPIAHTMGVSIKDTATAVGLLGKSGIIGETAGTALRSAMVNMAKPTKMVKEGLAALGIQAFDASGNFKGLGYVITQLGNAQKTMTAQQFTMNAAMAFGKPALSGMTALAHQGGVAFQQYGLQVGRAGGAAALAAAESKGLGGAMRGLGKQITSTFLQVYLGISPVLEKITRGMTSSVSSAIPYIKRGIRTATDLWDIYGPAVEKKLGSTADGVRKSASGMLDPLKASLVSVAVTSVPLAITSVGALDKTFHNATDAVAPLAGGLHDMFASVSGGAGAVGVLAGRLQVGVGALGTATGVLRPLAELVGGLAHAFAGLPGPIQLSVIAMLAMRPFRPQIQAMQASVVGFGRAGVQSFNGLRGSMQMQTVLAQQAGVSLGRYGAGLAAIEARSPVVAAMGNSFRTTSTSIQEAGGRLSTFRGTVAGVATALGTGAKAGLMSSMKGLYSFLGGPWGVAIGAAMIGLDLLAKHQQQAAAAAAAHQARISSLAAALQQSNGAINQNVRAATVQTLADATLKDGKTKLLDVMGKAGVNATQLTNAYLDQNGGVDKLRQSLQSYSDSLTFTGKAGDGTYRSTLQQKIAYRAAADALGSFTGETPAAIARSKDLAAALKSGSGAATDATNPTGRLQAAIATLGQSESDSATKASALHTALQLLSGGELDVEAAVAQQNQALLDLNSTWKNGVDHSQGYAGALLQVDGSLNTTSQNGQTLWTKLQALNEQTAAAAQASYDYARTTMGTVPALQQSEQYMQKAWDTAVKTGEQFGWNAKQAQNLAAQMGFIPSSLAITMSTPGLSDTEKQLLYVQGLAGHLSAGQTVKVSALTADAVKQLTAVGIKIQSLPGGRQMVITAPTDKAAAGLDKLLAYQFPDMTIKVSAVTQTAINDLESVKKRLAGVPGGHSIKVTAPSGQAMQALKDVGYKVLTLPNGKVSISVPVGGVAARIAALQQQIKDLQGTTVTITTNLVTVGRNVGGGRLGPGGGLADGGLVGRAADGLYLPGYQPRVDSVHVMLGLGEGVLVPETVRKLGLMSGLGPAGTIKALNAWGRYGSAMRFSDGGMVGGGVQHFASGGITYTPTVSPVLGSPTDAKNRLDTLTSQLTAAWKTLGSALDAARSKTQSLHDAEDSLNRIRSQKHTVNQLLAAEKALRNARQASAKADNAVAGARFGVNSLDRQLGLRNGSRAPGGFDLTGYQKILGQSLASTEAWRVSLGKVAHRGGEEVRSILEGMGQDGYALTQALAKASDRQFADIVAKLKATAGIASASLADFQSQVTTTTKASAQFAADLQTLARQGYGSLAQTLAAQNDPAAQALAHQAVSNPRAAAGANAAAWNDSKVLAGQDLTDALTLLATLRGRPGRGFADLIGAGLTVATIRALVPRMLAQINALPAANRATFMAQLKGQSGSVPMAEGGILTRPTAVLAGEAGVPEAYIPINASIRSLGLLARTAAAMGYQIVPAGRWARGAGGGGGTTHVDRSQTVHLHGTHQSLGEQRADLLRHMAVLG